jgi:hypothetical protein
MSDRTPIGSPGQTLGSSNAILEIEMEIHETTAFEVFEAWLDSELIDLEERFSGFVTRNSFAGSIGR